MKTGLAPRVSGLVIRCLVLGLSGIVLLAVATAPGSAIDQPRRDAGATGKVDPGRSNTPSLPGDELDATSDLQLTIQAVREGDIRVDADVVRGLEVGDRVAISPLAGVAPEVFRVDRLLVDGVGASTLILSSTEFEESTGVLVAYRGWVTAWIQSPGFRPVFEWRFMPRGPGRLTPMPQDTTLPGCGGVIDPLDGPAPEVGPARLGAGGDADCVGCVERVADVAFFYTSTLRNHVAATLAADGEDPEGAHDEIVVSAVADAAKATLALGKSALPYWVQTILVEEVDFDEAGDDFLGRFVDPDDGYMDGIHLRRDEVFADVCSLITLTNGGGNYCGLALLGDGVSPGSAFNTVVWGCLGGFVFAHEFGHNLGCCHAKGDGGGCGEETECMPWEPVGAGCCMPDRSYFPDEPWLSSYNHGWRWVELGEDPPCLCTVMAYERVLPGQYAQRIPYYSNPDVDYLGQPTGSPMTDPDGKWADNAQVIRENFRGTSAFRCRPTSASGDQGRLAATDLADADFFGDSVATNGVTLAVGASHYDLFNALDGAGAVFLFTDPLDEPDEGWTQTGKITTLEDAGGERLGASVAMYDDLLVIGAPYSTRVVRDPKTGEVIEELPLAGRASIWSADGDGTYCWLTDLQPDDLREFDEFGTSVAVSGDLVAIGAPLRDTADGSLENAGAVWIYRRVGDAFELVEVLEGTDGDMHGSGQDAGPGGRFGLSVAAGLQEDRTVMILVGAPREGIGDRGAVYPYRYVDIGDGWEAAEGSTVVGASAGGAFGASIAIEGEDVIVGAPESLGGKGRADIFRVVAEDLVQTEMILMPDEPREGDRLGQSVAISETFATIGVPGRDRFVDAGGTEVQLEDVGVVIALKRELGDSDWEFNRAYAPIDLRPGDGLGASVCVAGWYLIAGAPTADDQGALSGVVYAFNLTEGDDCNGNGIDDSVDILVTGESEDYNGDGVPDECAKPTCDADFNGDGVVDGSDLGDLFVAWGDCPDNPDPDAVCVGDLDGNGVVNGSDLGLFCSSWGFVCEDPAP